MANRAQLDRIADRHGLGVPTSWPHPWIGATSRVWPCGNVVIKVAMVSPEAERAMAIDAAMNPVARSLGVRAPALIVFDDSCEIVPAPYAIYERVPNAVSIGELSGPRQLVWQVWKDAGRNLARVHAVMFGTPMPVLLREFRQTPELDPRPWVEDLAARGRLAAGDASWLHQLLDAIATHALADVPLVLCHGDVNASNILVAAQAGFRITLIDWAGAGWLDVAWDFVGVPLAVVPHLLAGHREVAPLPVDDTSEARILWCQLQTRLLNARMQPDDSVARARLETDIVAARAFARDREWC